MKIKKKAMNKIQNEMRRRFGPYWERKSAEIGQLQRAVVQLQREVQTLNEFKANTLHAEASDGDKGKHVATPEADTPKPAEVWEAHFHIFGGQAVATIPIRHISALKNLGIEYFVSGSASNPNMIRVQLLTTTFPGKSAALREQVTRIMGTPVKIHWRKLA